MAKATAVGLAALQRAVYDVLNTPPITEPIGAEIYDDIPPNAPLPCLRIEITPSEPYDTFGRAGVLHLLDIHVFTAYQGTLQASLLLDAITNKLDHFVPVLVGFTVDDIGRLAHRLGEDELVGGEKTHHRVVPFRVYLKEGEQS